ncbi:hypothetical protein D1007_38999 [Hordeum vulgare]|nr:hypothetical protein D1007_38999 [Hordeum vulgare]
MGPPPKKLVYSFVARGTAVLADHAESSGNFASVAAQCLQKLPPNNNRLSYNCDGHTFNYHIHDGFTYCVVATESAGRQLPIGFIERVKEDFAKKYSGGKAKTAGANSLKREFGYFPMITVHTYFEISAMDVFFRPKLKEHMKYCDLHPEEIDKLAKVKAQVSEVKGVMMQNIEKVLDRGEKIELLVDKTEDLRSQAQDFKKQGTKIRQKMWWENMKIKLIAFGIIVLLILVIILTVCRDFKCW